MTTPTDIRPPEATVPTYRFWGERKPPKNRADFFGYDVAPVAAAADGGDTAPVSTSKVATLRVYGPIDSWGGWWGISAKDVSEALDALGDVDEIRVRINSPGGEAWEGLAILNMLRAHPAKVVAVVDGLAASAASFIASGCDETVMSPGTQLMIHDASGFAYGPADVMRKAATFLDSVSNSIASLYSEAAGGTDADWRALMVETTWYTAAEAVESGLADRVAVVPDAGATGTAGEGDDPVVDPCCDPSEVEDRFDLSMYPYAGRSHAPAPKPPTASAVGRSTTQEGSPAVAFSDEQVTTMRQKLGVAEDADEATILAALDEALDERTEPAASTEVPEGHVVIPEARLKDLEAGAALAVSTAASLHNQERTRFLDENRGKYVPASRAAWEKEYDRDPVATRAHFAEAPVIVPTDALGHDGQPDTTDADALYAAVWADEKKGA